MKISKLNIIPSENTAELAYNTSVDNGIGGVIGFNRTQHTDIKNVVIDDSVIGTDTTTNLTVGGLVGLYQYTKGGNISQPVSFNMENIEVRDTQIISNKARAGGLAGYIRSDINTITNCVVENCDIISNQETVGGVIGIHYPYNAGSTNITNVQTISSDIKTLDTSTNGGNTIGAGGIIGYVCNQGNIVTLSQIYVGNGCNIRGSKGGGGVFGLVEGSANVSMNDWIGVGAKYSGTDWIEDTVYNNISGRIAGGITGSDDSTTARSISAKLCVAKNRIYSYDRMGNANGRCGSGGLTGYKNGSSGQVVYDEIIIKHNVIATSGRGLTAAASYGSGNNNHMPAVGGMYGRVESNSGNTTECANITLEDNSIGFYDVSDVTTEDRYETYKNLTISSADVKIFYYGEDNKLYAVNWSDSLINEENVGRYSIGVGTFIGYYLANNAGANRHINILRPNVSFADTIGSIPVVDCGNINYSTATAPYGASYPYNYRNTVHIIYLEDEVNTANTILDSAITSKLGEDENFFERLDSVIGSYKSVRDSVVDESDSAAVKAATYNFIKSNRLNAYMTTGNGETYNLIDGELNYYDETYSATEYNNVGTISSDGAKGGNGYRAGGGGSGAGSGGTGDVFSGGYSDHQ